MSTSNPGRWKLSDLKNLIDCATAADGHIIESLRNIAQILEDEQNANFILGKVIIENDLLEDDDEDDDHNADDD